MTPASVIVNANVITLDDARPRAQAVAVANGRIAAVGSNEDVRALAGAGTREVDLAGQTLVPGFVDAHSHVGMVGDQALHRVDLNSPPIGRMHTMDDVVAALRARAEQTPEGQWVVGSGYDDTLLAELRHPTRSDLDRVSTKHPVACTHISGHLAAANSVALARGGLTRDTPQPVGGVIRRDASGEPDGVLEEPSAFAPVFRQIPARREDERRAAIGHAAGIYARLGVTTAQNGYTDTRELLDLAAASSGVPVRIVAWPGIAASRRLRSGELSLPEHDPERFVAGATKLFADGSIQGYTGHLCDPYHVPFKDESAYRGYAAMPSEELAAQVAEVIEAGQQVAVHTNGDAAIDAFLDAVDAGLAAHPHPDTRPISVHAQMAREDQLDRMQRLGVVPSFFCLHTYYWGDRHRDVFLGPERARRISPMRSARDRGMRFTIHTDAPVVPMDPILLMWSAANRVTTGGEVLGPEQCIDALDALRATTIEAAWQLHLEDSRGSITAGKLADFAVLSADPLDDPAAIRDVQVRATFVAGEQVHG